jgi:hypothetical protein
MREDYAEKKGAKEDELNTHFWFKLFGCAVCKDCEKSEIHHNSVPDDSKGCNNKEYGIETHEAEEPAKISCCFMFWSIFIERFF